MWPSYIKLSKLYRGLGPSLPDVHPNDLEHLQHFQAVIKGELNNKNVIVTY
jgi:hypothetical protein